MKREFLELLDKDVEFRYAVAGYLGLSGILKRLDKLVEEQARLREDFNKMYRQMDARLTRVERTLEKITVDIEDEARIIVKHRLREMGYEVEVGRAS
ncbi:MAG: hypothetical protein QXF59_01685 [Candidatus Bathyarchaeia archaeon]